jgi:hypothetical protein
MHHVVMFSGGVGSYCAAKRVITQHWPEPVTLLFADTCMEDEDLYRFLDDASRALDVPITRIADGRTPWQVFKDRRFLGNSRVDLCSRILKRELMDEWITKNFPDPTTVRCYVGIDWNEEHRFTRMAPRKLPYVYEAPMIAAPFMLKEQMLDVLKQDGVEIPRLYTMGFAHNNCGGFCVKAGVGSFKTLLKHLPERYAYHEAQEAALAEHLGKPITILRRQRGKVKRLLSLKTLREEVQSGKDDRSEDFDIGGCGCALE